MFSDTPVVLCTYLLRTFAPTLINPTLVCAAYDTVQHTILCLPAN